MLSALLLPISTAEATPSRAAAPARLAQASTDVPDLAAMGWTTVVDDQFNDTDPLMNGAAPSVWKVDENNDFGKARASAVDETGGALVLRTYTDGAGKSITGRVLSGGNAEPIPNGLSITYGYIEAEIKLETKSGVRNAFWTLSPTIGNSPFGDPGGAGTEVDIFEHVNNGGMANKLLIGKHWDGVEEAHKSDVDNNGLAAPAGVTLLGSYHKYSLLWDPSGYVVYVDGKKLYESTQALTYQPEHLRFTAEVVGGYAGPEVNYGAKGTPTNNVMSVNYVKVMQRTVSKVPTQTTASNTPLAVPFTVADYRLQDPAATDTESVTTEVSSTNTTIFPAGSLAVAGDGPTDPDGSFENGGLESPLGPKWNLTGSAAPTSASPRYGTGALTLGPAGGRATQTVTGLRPSTTYAIDAWYDLAIEAGDSDAKFEWGIQDVDSSRAGDQTVSDKPERLSWMLTLDPPIPNGWRHDLLTFTTGPSTTSVQFFVANDMYVSGGVAYLDSTVKVDGITITPVVPPERTILATPAPGKSGTAPISVVVNRRDRLGGVTTIGWEVFDIVVTPGSSTNMSFEAPGAAPTGWTTSGFAPVVDPQRFQRDRNLMLAGAAASATQTITGLEANTWYRLSAAGSAETSGGDFTMKASGYDGTSGTSLVLASGNTWTGAVTFKTDASHTSAVATFEDTDAADGYSAVKHAHLVECTSSSACPTTSDVPVGSPPSLSTIPAQAIASGGDLLVSWNGNAPTGVTATNPDLLPPANVVKATAGTQSAMLASPSTDRTGNTTLTVSYSGGSKPIDLAVSDAREVNPGFEQGATAWTLASGASVQSTEKRSGTSALRVNDGSGQSLQVVGGLDYDTTYAFGASVKGKVQLEVRDSSGNLLPGAGPTSIGGAAYTKGQVTFTTGPDPNPDDMVTAAERAQVRLVVKDDTGTTSTASYVDDTFLFQGPTLSPVREWSLRQGQNSPASPVDEWTSEVNFSVGRIPANGRFDPSVTSITVAPSTSGVTASLVAPHPAKPGHWRLVLAAPSATFSGLVNVTITLTDPGTGVSYQRVLPVDVNAGNNFNNGRFQRWDSGWTLTGGAGRIGPVVKRPSTNPPYDRDTVLWLSDGKARYQVTGLTVGASYTLSGSAIGTGGSIVAYRHDGTTAYGSAAGTSGTSWVNKSVTFTAAETDAWVEVKDAVTEGSPDTSASCVSPSAAESCWDDISLFKN